MAEQGCSSALKHRRSRGPVPPRTPGPRRDRRVGSLDLSLGSISRVTRERVLPIDGH